ncbi:MAG: glycosyltransferase [Proteobacteria bacterium]|nr:glycosyltransferase [Pseudomonadota bacterium]
MSKAPMLSFSIIIPVKPGGYVLAREHLEKAMPDEGRYEILLAEGSAPSRQRNLAAKEARGDILYFLDDDSVINPENLDYCTAAMSNPAVAVVGGPSITPAEDSWIQQLFGCALASAFGTGAVNSRYRAQGEPRTTTDKELILCNLAVRRSVFTDLNGFNECLYPNEENEFLERAMSAGYSLLHVPSMFVFRSQRRTLHAFIRQMFNYGRGRGQQTLITSSYSLTSFIPLFFIAYLVLSLICIKHVFMLVPLVIYVSAALVSSLVVLSRTGHLYSVLLLGVYPLMHIVNGAGLLWGLLSGKPGPAVDSSIQVRRIKTLGDNYPGVSNPGSN